MTLGGWIFMILSWSCIIVLIVFSYSKILSSESNKDK